MKVGARLRCRTSESKHYDAEFIVVGFITKDGKTYADLHTLDQSMGIDVQIDDLVKHFEYSDQVKDLDNTACGNCMSKVKVGDLLKLNEYARICPNCHGRLLMVPQELYLAWLELRNNQLETLQIKEANK